MNYAENSNDSVSPELMGLLDEIEIQATDAADPVDTAFQIHDAISSWVSKHYRRSMKESEKRVVGTLLDLTGNGISGCYQDAEECLNKLKASMPFLKVRKNPFRQMGLSAPAMEF